MSRCRYGIVGVSVVVIGICIHIFLQEYEKEMSSQTKAELLFKRFWTWRLEESPELASFIGNHAYDGSLESYSLESFEERKKACSNFLNEANEILSESAKEDQDVQLNLQLFIADLEMYIEGMKAKGYLFPINFLEGVQIEFERLVSVMEFATVEDYHRLISRYRAFPQQVNEIIEVMKEGMKLKMTNHAVSMKGVLKQFDDLQVSIDDSVFYKPFLSIPQTITSNDKKILLKNGRSAISVDLLPSFARLRNFIETDYMQVLRPNTAVSSLPNGKQFYQQCLTFHLGFSITPQEVHDMGMKEVERIAHDMEEVIKILDLDMTRKNFSERIRNDKDFYFNSKEELIEAYKGLVFNKIQPRLHEIFKNIPELKLSIKPAPQSMASGPAAYYLAGTPDGKRPGVFYVKTSNLTASPKYEMMTLALHEGEPGHHLQISYMMELKKVPEFRRHIEDRKYSDAPSRFPLHTAYIEGWGLYSEYLGYELGMYEDPYFHYGHLSHEMFRACRLVVDTGIHSLGWTREQAVDYMLEYTASSRENIESEVNRYITWPGQACAYKVGEMKIKMLREKAQLALGNRFDIQEFHDVVLQSAGPLNLLEKQIEEYIQKNKN